MSRSSYQYETSPRKYEPDYDIPRKRTQEKTVLKKQQQKNKQ